MTDERLVFGLDLGIASCGWAVLRQPTHAGEASVIEGLGSWCFDAPENPKDRTPKNQERRGFRLLRRVLRRRCQRMADIRGLFHANGLLPSAEAQALHHPLDHRAPPHPFKKPSINPWDVRGRGLDEALRPLEFAVALGHIAKHRGFKSSAKRKTESPDDKKMLSALKITQEKQAPYRTVGEMFACDPDFQDRKRNREKRYDRTVGREDLTKEVTALFAAQRRFGQAFASPELEKAFTDIAFYQRPLQDSERLVGLCPFEPTEKRAAKRSPSFEKFRLLQRLVNLRVKTATGERALTPEEIARATADLGSVAKLTVKAVRKKIGLSEDEPFVGIPQDKPDQERDIAAGKGEAMGGTKALKNALGEDLWQKMLQHPDQLDAMARAFTFFESSASIAKELRTIPLEAGILEKLLAALEDGKLTDPFKGAGHISAKACRNLVPYLEQGLRYDEACAHAGYNHAASTLSQSEHVTTKAQFTALVADVTASIANPVARKALTEGLKQLWALRNRYGLPGAVHIEMARDVGNSAEKRGELDRKNKETQAKREKERGEAQELLGIANREDVNGDTLLRYRLWKEQNGRCPYTDQEIHPDQIAATDNSVQVDHILPWSRFGDDSFNNKVLCLAKANQDKGGQTPYEWFSRAKSPEDWLLFAQRIETNKNLRGFKKRNCLLKNADEVAQKFRSRNLNDTRYATRLLAEAVKLFYPVGERQEKGGHRRVFTRPGALTATLRHAWGLESLKKVNGERVEDSRHHAIDALTVAAVGEGEVQRLTQSFQQWEQKGLGRPLRHVTPPWPTFRDDVLKAYDSVFVARPERRRARGAGHKETIRQVWDSDQGPVVSERKDINELTAKNLDQIKDPERNAAIIESLKAWIEKGKPADALPRSPQGDVITKVRCVTTDKPGISVRGGTAARGEMVRVDVFSQADKKDRIKWFLVPIYPHQLIEKDSLPPNKAVVAHKDERDWTDIGPEHTFCFSLYDRSYVRTVDAKGKHVEGYLAGGVDRDNGKIRLFSNKSSSLSERVSTKTLLSIRKYTVDRFGQCAEVKREVRTWHGEVCTLPKPPD